MQYFREAAPKHNADEEESLFPRVRDLAGIEVQGVLSDMVRLEQEHHWATPLHMEVDRIGRLWLANGELGKDEAQAFRTAVEQLAAMYRTHLQFEDSVLFPLANRILAAGQAAEIAAEMAKRRNLYPQK
ncbi:MAG: hemerythrin domain-containing protein [Acidobacteriaceae bacterium]